MWDNIKQDTLVNMDDSFIASKEIIGAVLSHNEPLLKTLLTDTKHICCLNLRRSVRVEYTALDYAILNNDLPIIKLLLKEIALTPIRERCAFPVLLLTLP